LINAIRKKYDRLKTIALSNALEKVLEIFSKPNGTEEFYCQLDKMIINRNRMKKSLMIIIKNKDKIKQDAFIKAFSWVASPD
jgi:GTP1/Obg family GTP-binding protein